MPITFALGTKEQKQLETLAYELSLKEGKKVTNGEVIRRAIRQVYGLPEDKQKKSTKLGKKGR